jgi:hypothetical protein
MKTLSNPPASRWMISISAMRTICVVVVICTGAGTVSAQLQLQDIRFGAKAGLNLATHVGDGTDIVSNRTAFHIGGIAEIQIMDKLFLAPEILYSAQGSKEKDTFFEDTYKIDYLIIPVMVNYYVAENFSLNAGPQLGILLRAKVDFEEDGTKFTIDSREYYSDLDLSLDIGAGYRLGNGLFFQGRYNIGLTNVLDSAIQLKQQNSVFQISAGYMFRY